MSDGEISDDEIARYFEIVERDGVRFEPVFPPSYAEEPTSFFGGLPRLPAQIPWPESEIVERQPNAQSDRPTRSVRVASNFVGQIDLAQLPIGLELEVPRTGTLFFFVDTTTEDLDFQGTTGGHVIYWNESTANVPARPEPPNLGPCFGRDWEYFFGGSSIWVNSATSRRDRSPDSRCALGRFGCTISAIPGHIL